MNAPIVGFVSRRSLLRTMTFGLAAVASAPILAACAPAAAPTATPAPAKPAAPAAPAASTSPPAPAAVAAPTVAAAAPAPKPAAAAPAVSKPAANVKLWYLGYRTPELWRQIYAEFETKNPGIKIEELAIPFGEHEQKVLTTLAAGQVIDIVPTHPTSNATLAAKNAIISIDDYLAKSAVGVKDFLPGAIEYSKHKNKYWSLSYYSGPWLLYYNRKLIQDAGLTDPGALYTQKLWTREKLGEYAAALTKGTGQDKIFGMDFINPDLDKMCMYIWGDGGEIWNAEATETLINSDAGVKAYSFFVELIKKGHVPNRGDVAAFSQVPGGLFGSNKIGQNHRFRGAVTTWDAAPVTPNVAVVPIPMHPNGQFYSVDGPNSLGISPKSTVRDQAWEAVYFAATRGNEKLMEDGSSSPTTRALLQSELWKKGMRPWESTEVYNFAATNVKALYMPPGYTEITKLLNSSYDSMIGGSVTVKAALDLVKPKIDAILKEQAG